VEVVSVPWPQAALGHIARLRALHAGLPGTWIEERTIDAPFERVWGWVADLERSVPSFDVDVASLRIVDRPTPTGFRVHTRSSWRALFVPVAFDVDLEDGWCWMVSRPHMYVVGMAAEPDGARTRWAHLEGIALGGPALLRPVLSLSNWRHRRHIGHDIDGIVRAVTSPAG
jgi:hypothetical protein